MSKQADRKNLLAQLFVVLLIGLAYQEMIPPIRDDVRAFGLTFPPLALFLVFFLTSLRFFIGAQLHLVDEAITEAGPFIWLFDFIFIAFEMIIFVFLGGLTTLAANTEAHFDFIQLLMFIYGVDVLWVAGQFLLAKLHSGFHREQVPWKWAAINLVAIALIAAVYNSAIGGFSQAGLWALLVINAIAFILDVIIVDYFRVVRPSEPLISAS